MEWISAKSPPSHENEVLICSTTIVCGYRTDIVDVGYYNQSLKCWRPRGCNGNWNDKVLHWMEKPFPPVKESHNEFNIFV